MRIEPYLFFHGTCEEALTFYAQCFDGAITALNRYEGSPMEQHVGADYKHKVMHASFAAGDMTFMASDGMPGAPPDGRDDIALSIGTEDKARGERIFNALAEGGTVTMPLQEVFWGGKFGTVTDRFGVQWMLTIG